MMKPFSKWTILEIEKEFQVELQRESPLLDSWLSIRSKPAEVPTESLEKLESRLLYHIYDWNEEELKFKFIGPLLNLVDFDQEKFQTYLERVISAPYQNDTLAGNVDFIVASGTRAPEQPYFFIHEHKKDIDSSGDPLGQLLIAMIAAQILNHNDAPLYGTYVIGRHWYFVVLHKKEYAVSLAYDATQGRIADIYHILTNTKATIEQMTRNGHSVN